MITTKEILTSMLTENTGKHMLDSGGEKGRMWQRNQGKNFDSENCSTLEISLRNDKELEISFSHNIYHWLEERLEYYELGDSIFHAWSHREANEDKYWLQCMEKFVDYLGANARIEVGGIYGEGNPFTVNTYNHESLLSQTLQFIYFSVDSTSSLIESGTYVLLQVHGGADVRGGYTKPRMFTVSDYDGTGILTDQNASIACKGDHYWDTDDGYHWYEDGTCGTGFLNLEKRDAKVVENSTPWIIKHIIKSNKPATNQYGNWLRNKVWFDDDVAHCPTCGMGFYDS